MSKTIPEHMEEIEKIHQLAHEHEADARHVWPKRWEAMKEIFEDMVPIYKSKEEDNGTP